MLGGSCPARALEAALKLKICVLTRPQRLQSHAYSRTRPERSPPDYMVTYEISELLLHIFQF